MAVAAREFQVFVKPGGAICNLDCGYCYYLKKQELYPDTETFRMPDDLLEDYIVQHITASPKKLILFSWHGGEPTILGLDYFRRIVEIQERHKPEGRRIVNGIQTNGILLDEEWCRFLSAKNFFVGLSLDGPREFHDGYRINRGKQPTHRQVVQSFRLLDRHRVPCDVLCVVHNENVVHPLAVYRFFKEMGVKFLQFLPAVARLPGGGVRPETPPADAYGRFLSAIFHEWLRKDLSRIVIQNFDEALKPHMGLEHALCIFREDCGDFPVIEHNGDFYACDHFVDREHHFGNLRQTPLLELLDSQQQRGFGSLKRDALPNYCRNCDVLEQCNGGCPKDRFLQTPDGEDGLNYLCAGLYAFFTYSRPYLQQLAAFLLTGGKLEQFRLVAENHGAQVGRNDPCPCGSGRKYKKCCLLSAGPPR